MKSITINIVNDNEITKSNWFALTLPDDANLRFSQDFSGVVITWTWAAKVFQTITVVPNLRVLKFKVADDLKKWESFTITWLKLVIYSKPQWDKYIWIDVNADWMADVVSSNWFRIDTTVSYSDVLPPSEVFDFSWSLVDNKFTVSASMPWDLDFQWVQLDNLDKDGKILSGFFRFDLNNFTYDFKNWITSVRVKTVDIRANYSTWLVFPISFFQKPVISSTWTTNTTLQNTWTVVNIVTNTWVVSNTWSITSTWITVSSWSIIKVIPPKVIVANEIEKYFPDFKNKWYADFMVKFDKVIDKKGYKKETRIIRNSLILDFSY